MSISWGEICSHAACISSLLQRFLTYSVWCVLSELAVWCQCGNDGVDAWRCRALFRGENDFSLCLKESFPPLKTRMLTRLQWCKIRRLMGKPRRYSMWQFLGIPRFIGRLGNPWETFSSVFKKSNILEVLEQTSSPWKMHLLVNFFNEC